MATHVRETIKALMQSEKVLAALEYIKNDHPNRVEEVKELALVQGETGKERLARSPKYMEMLRRSGALDCEMDDIGNVFGYIYGSGGKNAKPVVLFEAHLDTVFMEDTPLAVRQEGSRLFCPGIGDDAGGLALNLSVLRAILHANLVGAGTLMIAGTACEEAQGNFNGMRKLLTDHPEITASVSIDGAGNDRICPQGVGVRRTEFIFRGPGGHSWADYGVPACMHAMCRAMSAVAAIEPLKDPKTTVNIGVISGGTSVGGIATEARVHVDMRSLDVNSLITLEKEVFTRVRAAVTTENASKGRTEGVTVEYNSYTDIPAAVAAPDSLIVQTAVAAGEALGVPQNYSYSASTNSNIPLSRGIPAVTLGYGGISVGVHTLEESYDPTDGYLAAQKALLVILALAGLDGATKPLV